MSEREKAPASVIATRAPGANRIPVDAVRDELWRRQAVCAAEAAATLKPGDSLSEFVTRLWPGYERLVGYVMPHLIHCLVQDGVLVVAADGRWNLSAAVRKAAGEAARKAGSAVASAGKATMAGKRTASSVARLALVKADLLAHPDDTVAARARRLGPQLGLKDRAARGQISAVVSALQTAA
ncbi:hypothetical protein ACIBJF_31200 [Streptomyces sp. NPDC050743]|uniref:hypothetical protein n=1 Tax=Streptomyces sp. NPDC050743 TaxID=3365634 RepID=UPI0037A7EE5F